MATPIETASMRNSVGCARVDGGHQNTRGRQGHGGHAGRGRLGRELELSVLEAAGEERSAEHEQKVPDDRAGDRRTHHLELAAGDKEHADDELGSVAERGVQEAADTRPGVGGELLGGVAEQTRERKHGGGGQREACRLRVKEQRGEGRRDEDEGTDERPPVLHAFTTSRQQGEAPEAFGMGHAGRTPAFFGPLPQEGAEELAGLGELARVAEQGLDLHVESV